MAVKKFRQRVTIILTDSHEGKFKMDRVFEPSIKGKDVSMSMACRVSDEVCQHVLSRYAPKTIIKPGEPGWR